MCSCEQTHEGRTNTLCGGIQKTMFTSNLVTAFVAVDTEFSKSKMIKESRQNYQCQRQMGARKALG